jgi:CDGSH-type Zn-finger protein/uncharacterized Fe-S cluster protein YjdI
VARRTYTTDRVAVHWDSSRCIHTARCINAAPHVFDPGRRPWIDIEADGTDTIIDGVERCPTGALKYERLDGEPGEEPRRPTVVIPIDNGPLMMQGDLVVLDEDGQEVDTDQRLTLCRCGYTRNPPYCDNSHLARSFRSGVAETMIDPNVEETDNPTTIAPQPNGPLELSGRIIIVAPGGQVLADVNEVALCRCGRSGSKPYCDGSHAGAFQSRRDRTITEHRDEAESPGDFEPNRNVEPPPSV